MKKLDDLDHETQQSKRSRRSFLKWGAMAAGAAAMGPQELLGQVMGDADGTPPPPAPADVQEEVAAQAELAYDLNNFADTQLDGEPIAEGEDVEVTAVDFTQGLRMAVEGLVNLDPVIRDEIVQLTTDLEFAVVTGDLTVAVDTLHVLRHRLICYSFEIDFAAGLVAFAESTSFSRTLIVLVDFLISLRTELIGVIYIFPAAQVIKIIDAFVEYKTCLTVIQIQQFDIYLRFWLFILSIRFRWGWLGLRVCIDILLIYISICLRITIVDVFRVCIRRTRRLLLLVQC